jgi:hypothetical protein
MSAHSYMSAFAQARSEKQPIDVVRITRRHRRYQVQAPCHSDVEMKAVSAKILGVKRATYRRRGVRKSAVGEISGMHAGQRLLNVLWLPETITLGANRCCSTARACAVNSSSKFTSAHYTCRRAATTPRRYCAGTMRWRCTCTSCTVKSRRKYWRVFQDTHQME